MLTAWAGITSGSIDSIAAYCYIVYMQKQPFPQKPAALSIAESAVERLNGRTYIHLWLAVGNKVVRRRKAPSGRDYVATWQFGDESTVEVVRHPSSTGHHEYGIRLPQATTHRVGK